MTVRTALLLALLLPSAALAVPPPEPRPQALSKGMSAKASRKDAAKSDPPLPATAATVPLPVPRPNPIRPEPEGPLLGDYIPPSPDLVEAEVPLDPIPEALCDELEASNEVQFERLPRIIEGRCGAWTPIRITAFTPKNGQKVTLENPVTTSCRIAEATLVWLKTSVQPAAQKHLGGPIVAFRQTGGYECRGRNRIAGAKLSEHATANAIDIGGFERANGVVVAVSDQGEAELGFLADIRAAACGPFTTVLGPGVAAHEEHFHLDLARRGRNGRTTYCR